MWVETVRVCILQYRLRKWGTCVIKMLFTSLASSRDWDGKEIWPSTRCILRVVHVVIKLAPAKIQVFVFMHVLYQVFLGASQLLWLQMSHANMYHCKHKVVSTSLKHYWYMQQVDTVFSFGLDVENCFEMTTLTLVTYFLYSMSHVLLCTFEENKIAGYCWAS